MLNMPGNSIVICLAAFALAGCNTSGRLTVTAQPSVLAAGFEPFPVPPPEIGLISTATATFGCPAARCGAVTVLAFVNGTVPNTASGITVEQAVRASVYKSAALKPMMQKLLIGDSSAKNAGISARLSDYFLDPKSASQRFRVRFADASGKPAYMAAYGRFIGNEVRVIMSISEKAAIAARYARPQWLN